MVCFSQCNVLFCNPKWMPSHFGWQHKIAGNYLTYILWCKWENLTTKRAINALPLKELFFSFNVGLFSFTALLRGKLHVTFRLIKDAANKKGVTSICNSYRGSVKKQKRKRKREMAEESTMNETHWNNKREISEESRARAQTTNSLTKTAASSQQQSLWASQLWKSQTTKTSMSMLSQVEGNEVHRILSRPVPTTSSKITAPHSLKMPRNYPRKRSMS